jgi:hypothetical protein
MSLVSHGGEILHDMPSYSNDEETHASGKVMSKFCTLGFVTSKKWVSTYITVLEGKVRIYDSKESCIEDPLNYVLNINLSKNHRVSPIKRKNYSQIKLKIIDFFCFYIELDNGIFDATRLIKIGCLDQLQAESIAKCIKLNIGPTAFDP